MKSKTQSATTRRSARIISGVGSCQKKEKGAIRIDVSDSEDYEKIMPLTPPKKENGIVIFERKKSPIFFVGGISVYDFKYS